MIAATEAVERRTADDAAQIAQLVELLSAPPAPEHAAAFAATLKALATTASGTFHFRRWTDNSAKLAFTTARDAIASELGVMATIDFANDEVQRSAELGLALLRLVADFRRRYAAEKAARNALDFDDLLAEMHRLTQSPALAHVVKSLRAGIHLLMVDEFQDTDSRQVEIVSALLGEELTAGRLFFVGDSKQSIYRFRGAQPQVFDDLRGRLPETGRLPLSLNFRSQPAIIDFVNHLFGDTFADYQPLAAARPQTTATPAVELLWSRVPDLPRNDPNSWGIEQQRQHEAATLANRLKLLIDSRAEIVGCRTSPEFPAGRRPVEPRDIAILFRALSDVRHYEEALRAAGIDYYLVGGRAFFAQQEVYDVLHLLRSIASDCDSISLLGALRSPWFGLADETLLALSLGPGNLATPFFAGRVPRSLPPGEQQKLQRAVSIMHQLRERKDRLSPAQLLEHALTLTAYDGVQLAEFLGERKLANLEKLIELARVAEAAGVGSLEEFVAQLVDFTTDPPPEPPASTSGVADNVVRLMTLHQSKGLEFPVVVLADINRPAQGEREAARLDRDLGPLVSLGEELGESKNNAARRMFAQRERRAASEELDRLFYVGCTRAADYLILSSSLIKFDGTGSRWLETLAKAFDLTTGASLREGAPQHLAANIVDPTSHAPLRGHDRANLEKRVAEARDKISPVPAGVASIEVNPLDRRRFSVTRLTGKLVAHRPMATNQLATSTDQIDSLGLGTLVHAVLEHVDWTRPQQAAEWAERLAPLHELTHARAAAREATTMIDSLFDSPLGRQIAASGEVCREVEFVVAWQHALVPDRLMIRGYIDLLFRDEQNQLWVVDYKTNQVTADGVDALAAEYALQMHLYALVVEQTRGESPVGMKLVFLRPGVEFVFAWDDDARTRAIELVDAALGAALQ
jgi:ATP-dependent helicase/nuclease subunit A